MRVKSLLSLLTIFLIGCSPTTFEKINLESVYYDSGEFYDFQLAEEFNQLIEDKESFALYVYLPTCVACQSFKPHLDTFVGEYQIYFYTLNAAIVDYTILADTVRYVPSVVLIDEGQPRYHVDPTIEEKPFTSDTAFADWFFARVNRLES